MTAKIEPRIDTKNRTRLEKVIPLNTPFVLQIEPSSLCNISCRFCPVGKYHPASKKSHDRGMLSMELFEKAIDGLADFDKPIKSIHLYGNGEPLLNKNFAKMVNYAKTCGNVEFVDTTTNGMLLNQRKIDAIIGAKIDKINISVNGLNAEQYFRFTGAKINYDGFLSNLMYLYTNRGKSKIFIKSISEFYSKEEKNKFFDLFSPLADSIYLENLTDPWPDHDVEASMGVKSSKSAHSSIIIDKYVCCPIFYTLVMNFDGTFSLCCVDWKNQLIIGDLKKNSIKEIWNSERLYAHQVQHLKGERFRNTVCRHCNQISQCIIDNIDPYRHRLLNILNASRLKN